MAAIDITSSGGGALDTGILQLENGVAMDSTLRNVADQDNTTSPLKLSTTGVQIESPVRITTSDASGFYLDCEDSATNNRFSIKRLPAAQEVTLDFASNPVGSTTLVGAIRTYQDGINLSNAMSFIEDGSVGIGTNAPVGILHLKTAAKNTRLAIDGDAGFNRLISYRTGGLQRFGLYVNNTAESGANAGSNFAIRAYDDAGTLLSTPFFINRASGNVGIGTTAPLSPLNVYNSSASVSNLLLLEQDTSAVLGQIINYRKNGSVNLTSGTEIGRLAFGGYFNSTYSPPSQTCSAITAYYGGTGTDRVGGLRLTTWNGGGATTRLQVAPDGKIGIGTTAATAKFQILGEGSTSATTALLVQNSTSATILEVLDDGTCSFGRSGSTNNAANFYTNAGLVARIGGDTFYSPSAIARQNSGVLIFYGKNNNSDAFSFDYNNSQASTSTGVSMINLGGTYNTQQGCQFSSLQINPIYDLNANTTTAAIARGIYYNPTITNLRVAQHYAWQNTSGAMIVNSATPQASAVLQADSTTQGFLPPRMTTAQKVTLAATATAGLMIYDTNLNKLCVYTGAGWETITSI